MGVFPRSALIFLAGFCIALAAIVYRHQMSAQPSYEEANVARHLLRGEGFASPFYLGPGPVPPSAFNAPVYPLIIAACYYSAPYRGAVLLLLINSACLAVIAVMFYLLGRWYALGGAAVCSAILLLLHPGFLFYVGDYWDSILSLAIFASILYYAARMPNLNGLKVHAALLGAAMGLLALTAPAYALSLPLIALVGLRQRGVKARVWGLLVAVLAGAAVLAPWTVRNYVTFHRIYLVRDELKFELYQGNPPFATGWLGPELRDYNVYFNDLQRHLVLSMGERDYFDLCGQWFWRQYQSDPAAFWRRTVRRLEYVFISDPTQALLPFPLLPRIRSHGIVIDRVLLHGFFAIGGTSGAWLAWRLRLRCAWIFFAGLLTTLPLLFCVVDDRYVLAFRSVLVFFTGVVLWATWQRLSKGTWQMGPPR